MLDAILQIVLPLSAVLVIAGLAFRRSRVLKQTGHDPIVIRLLHSADNPSSYLERVLAIALMALGADIIGRVVANDWVREQLAIRAIYEADVVRWAGLVTLSAGLATVAVSVHQMGSSWRIGIDRDHPGALVRRGLYAHVRHPIYAGMLLAATGIAAAAADVITAAVAVAAWVGVPLQARLEEEFLSLTYGDDYRAYMAETGRFWPF